MLLWAFVPMGIAAWQCGGQFCGVSLQTCCCNKLQVAEHHPEPDCPHEKAARLAHTHSADPQHAMAGSEDCHCTKVFLSSSSPARAGAVTQVAPVYAAAVLPVEVVLDVPREVEIPRLLHARAPPPQPVSFATNFLRGPPLS